jgi:LPXTG-motif cell wall-anchored protein
MKIGRLIGGFFCVAAGVLLLILDAVLEEGKVVFMIGDTNAPIVPAIGLILVGLALLISSIRRR